MLLVTAGRSSRWRRPEFQAELARIEKLPEASVVNIPKSGHWIHVDAPEALLDALEAPLRRAATAPRA